MNKDQMRQVTAIMKPLWRHIRSVPASGRRQRMILTYHGVSEGKRFNCIPRDLFREHIAWLKERYAIVSLSELVDSLSLPRGCGEDMVSITFDDGYVNFAELALPVMKEYNVHATVFVPSGKVGQYNDWDEGRDDFAKMPIMSYEELEKLPKDSVEIGSHGISHSKLDRLPRHEALREIVRSRLDLEQNLGRPVHFFSFPYGGYPFRQGMNDGHNGKDALSSYAAACTIRWGRFNSYAERYALRRVGIWDSDTFDDFIDKVLGYYDWIAIKENLAGIIGK
jgi:peptidoglycan/xylan/chitin deacetylase (PgdA/CDA1 family)